MQISFPNTTNNTDVKWKKCHYNCRKADRNRLDMNFTYFSWFGPSPDADIEDDLDMLKDMLLVRGGEGRDNCIVLYTISIVLSSIVLGMFLYCKFGPESEKDQDD